ncbi:hypothetical protein DPMN_007911 [Dreissena polymorpha]|uniref:Uncharacterized protein n=1 Tax=Dreissena polymorpha TaxID=45954 RepID=A0A9D4MWQ1_DREPO|nr:hypothetical protein DPMN_007911 [Dreissena polymorpha]
MSTRWRTSLPNATGSFQAIADVFSMGVGSTWNTVANTWNNLEEGFSRSMSVRDSFSHKFSINGKTIGRFSHTKPTERTRRKGVWNAPCFQFTSETFNHKKSERFSNIPNTDTKESIEQKGFDSNIELKYNSQIPTPEKKRFEQLQTPTANTMRPERKSLQLEIRDYRSFNHRLDGYDPLDLPGILPLNGIEAYNQKSHESTSNAKVCNSMVPEKPKLPTSLGNDMSQNDQDIRLVLKRNDFPKPLGTDMSKKCPVIEKTIIASSRLSLTYDLKSKALGINIKILHFNFSFIPQTIVQQNKYFIRTKCYITNTEQTAWTKNKRGQKVMEFNYNLKIKKVTLEQLNNLSVCLELCCVCSRVPFKRAKVVGVGLLEVGRVSLVEQMQNICVSFSACRTYGRK